MASKPLQPFTAVHTLNFQWAKVGNLAFAQNCADPECDDGTGRPRHLSQTGHEYALGEPVVVVPHATNTYAPWTVYCIECASKWDNFAQLSFTRNYKFQNPWAKLMSRLDPRFRAAGEIIDTEIASTKACARHGLTSFYSPAHENHLCAECEDHSEVSRALYDHYAHLSVEVHKDNEITRKKGIGDTPSSMPNITEEDADNESIEQTEEHRAKAEKLERATQKRASTTKERSRKSPRRSKPSNK